jgi:hypothetical protein
MNRFLKFLKKAIRFFQTLVCHLRNHNTLLNKESSVIDQRKIYLSPFLFQLNDKLKLLGDPESNLKRQFVM